MGGTSWVLDTALGAVSGVPAVGFVVVVGGDMVAEWRGSGLERGDCGGCRGELGRPGSMCCRLHAAGGGSDAGGTAIVVAVNDIGGADGGCAGVVSGDVAASTGKGGLATSVEGSFSA